ncbi:MAG TPA: protein kinase [Ktedonobacterales bacterium]
MTQDHIGRYRIVGQIGKGGMGTVVRAVDEVRGRDVAIKLPLESDPQVIKRLRREYDVLAQLQHHNIVEIIGSGSDTDAPFYVVMEFVDGVTVEEMLEKEGPFETRRALQVALGVAEALAHAHRPPLRVIHRDIKPGNVLIRRSDGMVKVTDFGIATVLSQSRGNTAVGTMAYIAPEQAMGQGADERSDLYSLGVLLYEMLTGTRPPQIAAALATPPSTVPGSTVAADLFDRVDRLVLGLLARDPSQRVPQTATEVVEELRAMLEGRPSRLSSSSNLGSLPFESTRRSASIPPGPRYPASPSSALPPIGTPSGYLAERAAQPQPYPPPPSRAQPAPYMPPPPQVQPVQVVPYMMQPGLAQPVYQVVQVVPVIPPRPTSGKAIASLVTGILLMLSSCAVPSLIFSLYTSSYDPYTGAYTRTYDGPGAAFLVLWLLFALVPVLLGHWSLKDIRRSLGQLAGTGQAIAGLVMGYIGVAALLFVLFRILLF